MGRAVPTVHLTFYHLVVVTRDRSNIYKCSNHSFLPSQRKRQIAYFFTASISACNRFTYVSNSSIFKDDACTIHQVHPLFAEILFCGILLAENINLNYS